MPNIAAKRERTTVNARLSWALATIALAFVLLVPAAYNGFPIIFSDTSAYFSVAYHDAWPVDRAGFYGFFLAPALLSIGPTGGMWLATFVQAFVIAVIVTAVFKRLLPEARPQFALILIGAVALTTSLSWQASQLLPDALTGALILLAWFTASRDVGSPGTPLLWLATAALTMLHFTHVPIVVAVFLATFLVQRLSGTALQEIFRRTLAAALTICAVLAAHTLVYGIYFNQWKPSPLSGYFLFARLNEDGLVPHWLDRHCGVDAPKTLCDIRGSIPEDSQVLLWSLGRPSPFVERINDQIGTAESWRWAEMTGQVARESLTEQPVTFAKDAAIRGAGQFLHFQVLDDGCPQTCRNVKMLEWQPDLGKPLFSSRQLSGGLRRSEIRLFTSVPAIAGLLLLLPVLFVAFRRKDAVAQSFLSAIAVSLLSNAALTGALSHVDNRYQSRVVWLAPFAVLLIATRWYTPRHLPRRKA